MIQKEGRKDKGEGKETLLIWIDFDPAYTRFMLDFVLGTPKNNDPVQGQGQTLHSSYIKTSKKNGKIPKFSLPLLPLSMKLDVIP